MFVYFEKETKIVFFIETDPPRITETEFIVAAGAVTISKENYDVIETDQKLHVTEKFNKYKVENDQIVYVNEKYEIEDKWDLIRQKRNSILLESDIESNIQLLDFWNKKTSEEKSIWLKYRKNLRDITKNFDHPDDVVFPLHPREALRLRNIGSISDSEWSNNYLLDSSEISTIKLI